MEGPLHPETVISPHFDSKLISCTLIHLLHPVLNQAFADQELLPARTAAEFAAMFETHATAGGSTPPLFGMMVPNVRSTARQIPKSNKNTTVARRSVTRSKTSS